MKRKSIVAKLLALSLVFSGLPMTSLQAAELPVTAETEAQEGEAEKNPADDSQAEAENQETEGTDNTDSAEQDKETQDGDKAADDTKQDVSDESGTDQSTSETDETNLNGFVQAEILNDAGQTDLNAAAEEFKGVEIAKDAKMAGSDGVLYDDVAYLSARNVMAMDAEQQELYTQLCDEVTVSRAEGMDLQNVVFAVNADGDLYMSYYVPGVVLEKVKADMQSVAAETLTTAAEEKKDNEPAGENQTAAQDEKKEGENADENKDQIENEKKDDETADEKKDNVEDEKKDDETTDEKKDEVEDEKKDNETSDEKKDEVEDEKKDNETSDEKKDQVEDEKKDNETSDEKKDEVADEKKDDETTDENQDAAEGKDDEVSDENKDAAEEEKKAEELTDLDQDGAEETEPEEAELVLEEENMDILPQVEEETFEVIESARVGSASDLGYGGGASDEFSASGREFNAFLPKDDYFVSQLNASQKNYYNALSGKLLNGSNQVTGQLSYSARNSFGNDICHALSALVLTYPDKTDWMAKPGGFSARWVFRGSFTGTYTVTVEKSQFYSAALETEAGQKAKAVGTAALQYAAGNYPNAMAYGVVKYFDQWICENGYYEMAGVQSNRKDEVYYNCHSAYGILLKGYGVCESYAKAMSRLLDTVGVPNVYVVGEAGEPGNQGGHAWNYVQMPNGKWYLMDSTWNDTTNAAHTTSTGEYLLVKEDGMHSESGCTFVGERPNFKFPKRSEQSFTAESSTDGITINQTKLDLVPRGTFTLTCTPSIKGSWTSSNSKVAKVNSSGKVTAVAGGTATITYVGEGKKAECTVNVDQIKSVKVRETKKTSETLSLGIDDTNKGEQNIVLTVDMGASPHTAEWMIANQKVDAPKVTQPTKGSGVGVATAVPTVAGNEITVKVAALKDGKVNLPVKFGGKTVTIKVTAGKIITKEMFDIAWPAKVTGTGTWEDPASTRTTPYTGKTIKPVVKKNVAEEYRPVTFSKTYVNNKNAGTAKLVIRGTGKYGGTIEYPFTITPVDITSAAFTKDLQSKTYNGGSNPPKTTVKLGSKTLKAGTDYEIFYNGKTEEEVKVANAIPVGTYTITIQGKGNYTGTVGAQKSYQVTQNTIAKVTVTGSSSVKFTGLSVDPYKVKIGKNVLSTNDYDIVWYKGQGKYKSDTPLLVVPSARGKYTAVITVKGNNLTTTDRKKEIVKKLTIK